MDRFIAWVQERLNAHGSSIAVDGVFGGSTRSALLEFQKRRKIKQSGVADARTVSALRSVPGGRAQVTVPEEGMPPWMAELYRRKGLNEVRDKAALVRFLSFGKLLGDPARLPWCGDAIESAMVKSLPNEPVPNNPFWAQGWAEFGIDAGGPKVGAIGVIRWSPKAGHVGIVAGYDSARRKVMLLGGNQSNAITLSWFPESKFIAFRWPKLFPMKAYPSLTGGGSGGGYAGTR